MIKTEIIAIGRMRKAEQTNMLASYQKRIKPSTDIIEIDMKKVAPEALKQAEGEKLLSHVKQDAYVITLDEHGKDITSTDLAKLIGKLGHEGYANLQFIIGGADGLSKDVKNRANMSVAFGRQTWPHMLVRIMLVEQIYRAQQILSGHPYHRA